MKKTERNQSRCCDCQKRQDILSFISLYTSTVYSILSSVSFASITKWAFCPFSFCMTEVIWTHVRTLLQPFIKDQHVKSSDLAITQQNIECPLRKMYRKVSPPVLCIKKNLYLHGDGEDWKHCSMHTRPVVGIITVEAVYMTTVQRVEVSRGELIIWCVYVGCVAMMQ